MLIITAAIAFICGTSIGFVCGTWWWARSPRRDGKQP